MLNTTFIKRNTESYNKWLFVKFFYKEMINNFDYIYAQSIQDKKRIEKLIDKKIKYIGNLKLAD